MALPGLQTEEQEGGGNKPPGDFTLFNKELEKTPNTQRGSLAGHPVLLDEHRHLDEGHAEERGVNRSVAPRHQQDTGAAREGRLLDSNSSARRWVSLQPCQRPAGRSAAPSASSTSLQR